MHRVGFDSPSPSGFSPEKQVFRKMASIMRFGNLALSEHKVTVTAARQLSLGWGGGGAEVSDCKPGDKKISIALNEEPELLRGNSITAPLRWTKPTGDVWPCSSHLPIRLGTSKPWSPKGSTSLPPSTVVDPQPSCADKAQQSLLSLLQLEYAKDNVWMQSTPNTGVCPNFGGAVYLYLVAVKHWLQTSGTGEHLGFISSPTPIQLSMRIAAEILVLPENMYFTNHNCV